MRASTSAASPPPSTIVVLSLVTTMRRAPPSTSRPTWSSLSPTSGATTCAPVRIARSWRIALRRSPNAGALTAHEENVPRMRLTTRVDSASPSTSSAMISSGLPAWTTFSSSGSSSCTDEILPWTSRMLRVLEHRLHAVGVGDEVRRDEALVELHALGELQLERRGARLLDGDDAVLADLVERVGDQLADLAVLRRRWWRRWRSRSLSATSRAFSSSCVRDRGDGLLDAALEVERGRTGGDRA